jgi:hypothetical protein
VTRDGHQPDDAQTVDSDAEPEPEDIRADDTEAEDIRADDTEAEDIRADDTEAEDIRADDTEADDTEAEPESESESSEAEADGEPEPADVDPGTCAAQRVRRRLVTRIVVLAVAPSVALLPLLLSRRPAPPALGDVPTPPTLTRTPPITGPAPSSARIPALTSGRAVNLIQDADQSLQYQTSRAQLLALAALEDAGRAAAGDLRPVRRPDLDRPRTARGGRPGRDGAPLTGAVRRR